MIQQPATGNGTVLQFAATSSGSVAPATTLAPGAKLGAVATDAVGNIYVFDGNVVEYSTETTGTPAQVREIMAGTASRICCVDGIAVSASGEVILGQDNGEVDEWAASATGAVAPTRFILGYSETGGGLSPVVVANQVAVDSADNLYVGAAGAPGVPQVVIFDAKATGNVAAARTVGPNGLVGGLAVDSAGNIYTTTNTCSFAGTTPSCAGSISVYNASATATSTPTRVIAGVNTKLQTLSGVAVDAVGNVYVISTAPDGSSPTVLTFAAAATGNVAPSASFTSTAWTTPGFNPSIAIY